MTSEQDPLLPQDKGAPEIYGSRAPSIHTGYASTEEPVPEEDDNQRFRRNLLASVKFILVDVALLLLFGLIFLGRFPGDTKQEPETLEERVDAILSNTPLIGTYSQNCFLNSSNIMLDGHNDFPILIRFGYQSHIYDPKFSVPFEQGGLAGHVDLPRLQKGKNGGAFWSVFAPCPDNGTDFSDENYAGCKYYCIIMLHSICC
jgi:membrane dipeptidase